MKSDEDRGPFAAWLRRQRIAKEWKEAEAKRRLVKAAKLGVSFSTYRDIEAGNRKPTADQLEAIVKVFGNPPTTSPTVDDVGLVAIAEAVKDQTKMLEKVLTVLTAGADPKVIATIERALAASEDFPPPKAPSTSKRRLVDAGQRPGP